MQEVFEKIDAILKKVRKKWLGQVTTEPCKGLECMSDDCVDCLLCHLENDINHVAEEYDNGWIPCSERMPKEHDSMFKKFKGTNRWSNGMFEKTSDRVLATIQYEDGTRMVFETNTADGKWREAERLGGKVIAWRSLPEPYRGE